MARWTRTDLRCALNGFALLPRLPDPPASSPTILKCVHPEKWVRGSEILLVVVQVKRVLCGLQADITVKGLPCFSRLLR